MSTEWNEDNIKAHMFTEVEVSDNERDWSRGKLYGFTSRTRSRFLAVGATWLHMRLIPKPKRRLMKPIELAGKWLDFAEEGMTTVIEFDNKFVFSRENKYYIQALKDSPNCQGWRDTPTSELHTSFEVDE
jgi:hypothetical protein